MGINEAFADAIETGDGDEVKRICAEHPELANAPGWTPPPLHCAVLWNQPEMAAILLDHGADIELPDPDRGATPLRYAIMYARAGLLPLLISRGANTGPVVAGGSTALRRTVS